MTDNGLFPFSSEHEMIREAARDFAQKEIAPIAAEFDKSGEFPSATIRKMGAMGFMGIEVAGRVRRRRHGHPLLRPGPGGDLQGRRLARNDHVGEQLAVLLRLAQVRHGGAEAEVPARGGLRRAHRGLLTH